MIFVGTDIVEIAKIEKLITVNGEKFLNHIFTEKEQEYCTSRPTPIQHYAGKFAAKEAIKKAIMSQNIIKELPLKHIEILNTSSGCPTITIKNESPEAFNIAVSISHAGNYATATAIFDKI